MSQIEFELTCDSCRAEYDINYLEGVLRRSDPMYCPFCGSEIDLTEMEEGNASRDSDQIYSEIDFEEDR